MNNTVKHRQDLDGGKEKGIKEKRMKQQAEDSLMSVI
jgi:hypothetical protein